MSHTDDYNWRATWTNEQLERSREQYFYYLGRDLKNAEQHLKETAAIAAEFQRRETST